MIPKIIHYCWFGNNPLPPLAIKCIASWKKYLPDFEIKEWNERNFDVNGIIYTKEAYDAKKYAFVSDYARFKILYEYGGLYFDTDVEIIKPIYDILEKGAFMGFESQYVSNQRSPMVAPGLGLAVESGNPFYKKMICLYVNSHFQSKLGNNVDNVVTYATQELRKLGLDNSKGIQYIDGIYIYPSYYFAPINLITKQLEITEDTRTIHWYSASWIRKTRKDKFKEIIRNFIPTTILLKYNYLKRMCASFRN